MEQRKRPVTYAESLEAKKYAEQLNKDLIAEQEALLPKFKTSLTNIEVDTLPSQGKIYPEDFAVYFAPLTFGEMKFLSGSAVRDKESIEFFMSKITCNMPVENLTYFDFFYLTVMIKLATFGTGEYSIIYECSKCGSTQETGFVSSEVIFEELRIPFPVTAVGNNGETYEFKPMTVGNYLKSTNRKVKDDYDEYMAYCLVGIETQEERRKIIREQFNGPSVSILEMIDASFFHGVQDIQVSCKHQEIINTGEFDVEGEEITREEVCGENHNIPFFALPEYIITKDELKESIRNRVHFGLQDGNQSD